MTNTSTLPPSSQQQSQAADLGDFPHPGRWSWIHRRNVPYYIAPILFILFVALLAWFQQGLSGDLLTYLPANLVKHAATFCLLAIGASLVISTAQIDLSSIGVATIAGILFTIVLSHAPKNPSIWWLLLSVFTPVAFAVLSGLLVTFCFLKLKAPMLIFTWALGSIYVITSILLTSAAGSQSTHDVSGIALPSRLPLDFWSIGNVGFFVAILSTLVPLLLIKWSNLDHQAAALGASEPSAQYAGVSKRTTFAKCYVLNAILAAMAGIVNTLYLGGAPTTDLYGKELIPVAVAVLGGTSLAGGYLCLPSVVFAALFWATVRLLGPQLPSLLPGLKSVHAEVGQILFFTVFIIVSLLFGKLLTPPTPKIFAKQESNI